MNYGLDNYKEIEQFLIIDRNKKWLETIYPLFKTERVFISAGLAHIAAENEILDDL